MSRYLLRLEGLEPIGPHHTFLPVGLSPDHPRVYLFRHRPALTYSSSTAYVYPSGSSGRNAQNFGFTIHGIPSSGIL